MGDPRAYPRGHLEPIMKLIFQIAGGILVAVAAIYLGVAIVHWNAEFNAMLPGPGYGPSGL